MDVSEQEQQCSGPEGTVLGTLQDSEECAALGVRHGVYDLSYVSTRPE